MSIKKAFLISAGVVAAAGALAATVFFAGPKRVLLEGTVLIASADAGEQAPITGVRISADGPAHAAVTSDGGGFFALALPPGIVAGQSIALAFRHPDYRPLDMTIAAGDRLIVARMEPNAPAKPAAPRAPEVEIANTRVRYSISSATLVTAGRGVKMFQVANRGNVPCEGRQPCSPDDRWKAATGSASLDAGPENVFRNARVSCVAGPCPFTRIDNDGFSAGGRHLSVTVRNWSDTATFVLQAEVVRMEMSEVVRQAYPVIVGRTMNFTLPA